MWLQNAKSRGVTNATSKDYQSPFDRLCICIRAVNGFALSVDGAALLEDRSFAPSSTDRATIDQWQKVPWAQFRIREVTNVRVIWSATWSSINAGKPCSTASLCRRKSADCATRSVDGRANERSSNRAARYTDSGNQSTTRNTDVNNKYRDSCSPQNSKGLLRTLEIIYCRDYFFCCTYRARQKSNPYEKFYICEIVADIFIKFAEITDEDSVYISCKFY